MSMKERNRAKFLAKQGQHVDAAHQRAAVKRSQAAGKRWQRERVASPEEQRARYLDCGPLAWDDRDSDGS